MRTESRELLAVGLFGRTSLGDRIEILLKRGREFSPRVSLARIAAAVAVLLMFVIAGSRAPRWIAFAQERPSFEVASIKPGDPGSHQVSMLFQPGGRFITTNAPVQMLVQFAYDVRPHQVSGLPKSIELAGFTIEAKAGETTLSPPSPEGVARYRLMVQSLLADRFKLTLHRDTREEQIYELVVDKGGSKFKEAADTAKGSPQGLRLGRGQLTAMAAPMPILVNFLSQQLGRSVIDKTGLDGKYDFTLKWMPDPLAPGSPPGSDAVPLDPSAPSLTEAIQEQLGLKLQPTKGPVEILVIDHVEKPSEN
jgi:uncharacterized protein (TIGR03435 family)